MQRISKVWLAVAIVSLLGAAAWGQAPQKNWKDRAEYDLFESIRKETNATKRLELLDSWKEKYAATDFRAERAMFYVQTYQELNQWDRLHASAQDLLKEDPKNIRGLYWLTYLTVSLANTAADRLDVGEKAAKGLLASLDETFAPDKRPPTTPEDAWKKERANLEALGHNTLGWVAMNRKNNEEAEKHFIEVLRRNPNYAQVSYWLGTVIAAQRNPDKQAAALWHFARAAYHTGEGAMPDANRKQIAAYFEKVYVNYHGGKDGLEELIDKAKSGAFPPAGFDIESAAEVAYRKEQQLRASNPQLALWLSIKKELAGPEGAKYFEEKVKNAALPKLRGKVVSQSPAARPKEVVLALSTNDTPEVTLRFEDPMGNPASPGTEVEFEGVPIEFSSEPFNLIFEIEKDKITGWPAPAPKKKVTPKKK